MLKYRKLSKFQNIFIINNQDSRVMLFVQKSFKTIYAHRREIGREEREVWDKRSEVVEREIKSIGITLIKKNRSLTHIYN